MQATVFTLDMKVGKPFLNPVTVSIQTSIDICNIVRKNSKILPYQYIQHSAQFFDKKHAFLRKKYPKIQGMACARKHEKDCPRDSDAQFFLKFAIKSAYKIKNCAAKYEIKKEHGQKSHCR